MASDTGDKNVDIAYTRWWDSRPIMEYEGDPRYHMMSVIGFQNKLLYMSSRGTDVSKLSVDELNALFEDEANFQAGATMAMSSAAISITKNLAAAANGGSNTIVKAGSKAEAIESLNNLPDDVAANVKRFIKKSGSGYTEYVVDILENGSYQVKMTKPGNVSGYAEYYKIIDSKGNTIQTFKDTFDNLGKLVHRKYK